MSSNNHSYVYHYGVAGSASPVSEMWDGENRLIEATPKNPAELDYRFFCTYDYLGRRVTKHTHIWYEGEWYPDLESVEKMFYEGWNVVYRENSVWGADYVDHYTWGLDLSGSLQGAGGVGGLLAVHHFPGYGNGSDYWYQFDGNGNVSEMMDYTGAVYMHYEYDPFGRITNNSPTWRNGDWNPFTFSTKYMDRLQYNDLSQAPGTVFKEPLYYYGYRHYSPELGRWLSRDPIGERGGRNLYGFVNNAASGKVDFLGLLDSIKIDSYDLGNETDGGFDIWYNIVGDPDEPLVQEVTSHIKFTWCEKFTSLITIQYSEVFFLNGQGFGQDHHAIPVKAMMSDSRTKEKIRATAALLGVPIDTIKITYEVQQRFVMKSGRMTFSTPLSASATGGWFSYLTTPAPSLKVNFHIHKENSLELKAPFVEDLPHSIHNIRIGKGEVRAVDMKFHTKTFEVAHKVSGELDPVTEKVKAGTTQTNDKNRNHSGW